MIICMMDPNDHDDIIINLQITDFFRNNCANKTNKNITEFALIDLFIYCSD